MSDGDKGNRWEEAFRVLGESPKMDDRQSAGHAIDNNATADNSATVNDDPTAPQSTTPKKRLADIDPDERGVPYTQWRADQLNELFRRHGRLGEPGRLTAQTVEDGLTKQAEKQRRAP